MCLCECPEPQTGAHGQEGEMTLSVQRKNCLDLDEDPSKIIFLEHGLDLFMGFNLLGIDVRNYSSGSM